MDHGAAEHTSTVAEHPGHRRAAHQHLPGLTGLRGVAVS
jgi:hypothetical protein